jgi:hypothetical protein
MKTKKYSSMIAAMFALAALTVSCSKNEDDSGYEGSLDDIYGYVLKNGEGDSGPSNDGEDSGNTQAGIITAGEWNDLDNWTFWAKLMTGKDFANKSDYWKFYTNNRIAIKVNDKSGKALAGIPVKLLRNTDSGQAVMWEAVTDNHGQAECWMSLYQKGNVDGKILTVNIDGETMEGNPAVSTWDQEPTVNTYSINPKTIASQSADIAFIVDATGSMGDEITFLKKDLVDIIGKASKLRPGITMRTAALFYRDEGDEYITRHSNFTENLSTTAEFVNNQVAEGGDDYPEAVHTALEKMLQDLSWDESAKTHIAFLILDAPAHHTVEIISSLQESIKMCAKKGIRLIPVSASGVDKNTEFMLRFFATATGGTDVFITNDSGVGEDHIAASVGKYEVEQLNELIVRLIGKYTE